MPAGRQLVNVATMSTFDSGLRRVAIHAGPTAVDLSLPAEVPVATLIPSIVDVLGTPGTAPARYRLSPLGRSALPNSTTLAQNGICDGAVLVLSQAHPEPPVIRCDDIAEAVSAALATSGTTHRRMTRLTGAVAAFCLTTLGAVLLIRNGPGDTASAGATAGAATAAGVVALVGAALAHRVYRDPLASLTLSLIATVFAAVAGLFAVPGTPEAPHLFLAAMAVAATSVLATRVTGGDATILTAVACCAAALAVVALIGTLTAAPAHTIGSLAALMSVGLMQLAPRISIRLAGLSAQEVALPTADLLAARALRADGWLTGLLAGWAGSAAIGAVLAALTSRSGVALGCVVGALLLLRARSGEHKRAMVYSIHGIATSAATFAAAAGTPRHGPWLAATAALLAAAALYLGFVAPTVSLSPVARRGAETLECLTLVAMVPLTCWVCGAFGAIRGLDLI